MCAQLWDAQVPTESSRPDSEPLWLNYCKKSKSFSLTEEMWRSQGVEISVKSLLFGSFWWCRRSGGVLPPGLLLPSLTCCRLQRYQCDKSASPAFSQHVLTPSISCFSRRFNATITCTCECAATTSSRVSCPFISRRLFMVLEQTGCGRRASPSPRRRAPDKLTEEQKQARAVPARQASRRRGEQLPLRVLGGLADTAC